VKIIAIAPRSCKQVFRATGRGERGFSLLASKLFVLLGLVSVLSVGATAWLISSRLESGFVGYLNAIESDRLDALAKAVAGHYAANGSLESLRGEAWPRLLNSTSPDQGGARDDERPPRGPGPEGRFRPPPGDRAGPADGPKGDLSRPPPRRDFLGLGPRASLESADGTMIVGRRPPAEARVTTREVTVDGRLVGRLLVAPMPHPVEARDTQFLSVQRHAIVIAAVVGVVLSLALAFLAARTWVHRIRDVEKAAARIASGEFGTRLADKDRDEIGALARSINKMAGSLGTLEQSRRKWLADIAHELRTPLAVLQGEIEALVDGVRQVGRPALQSLADEVRHLTRLTDDLHQLALSDMKALPMDRRPVDAAGIARRAVERWQPQANRAGLKLAYCGAERAEMSADEGRLTQLCDNLLGNSLRYTDAPGEVRLEVERDAAGLRLTFDDSPPALAAGNRAGLFEPLFRPDAARSRAKGGSGLGLALSRAIVELHGGRIEARDSPLGGLRIVAHFPAAARP
jgi:two-component system sensor histidine kinase BaeS